MKTKIFLLAGTLLLGSAAIYAQKITFDTGSSSIEWYGKKIGGQHEGNIQATSGAIEIMQNRIVSGEVTVDMTTISVSDIKDESSNQKLVGHLKSEDFFDVAKFPTAKLVIHKSTPFTNGKAIVSGDITIKGKTEQISFEVVKTGNQYSTELDIDRSKFDVRYGSNSFFNNLGDRAIDDIFKLKVKLIAG